MFLLTMIYNTKITKKVDIDLISLIKILKKSFLTINSLHECSHSPRSHSTSTTNASPGTCNWS